MQWVKILQSFMTEGEVAAVRFELPDSSRAPSMAEKVLSYSVLIMILKFNEKYVLCCSKLTLTLLVNETVHFQTYCRQKKKLPFFAEINFWCLPYIFLR